MRIVETPVYDFTELSDAAKDKARAWFRETIDHDWWDSVYDDFEQICPILGVTLATTHRPPDGRRHPPEALHLVFRVLVAGRRRLFRGPLCLCPARVASHPRLCAPGHGAAPDRRRAAGAAEVELLPAHGLVPADWPVLARLCDDVRRRPRQPCRPGDRRAHRRRPGRPRCAISPTGSIARSSANTSFRPPTKPSTRACRPMATPSPPKAGGSAERLVSQ